MDHPGPEGDEAAPPPIPVREALRRGLDTGVGVVLWYLIVLGIVRWLTSGLF